MMHEPSPRMLARHHQDCHIFNGDNTTSTFTAATHIPTTAVIAIPRFLLPTWIFAGSCKKMVGSIVSYG